MAEEGKAEKSQLAEKSQRTARGSEKKRGKKEEIRGGRKAWWIGTTVGWVIRIMGFSYRVECEDKAGVQSPERTEPVILVLWHDRIFSTTAVWNRTKGIFPMVALTSASKDGAILAATVGVLGVEVARGSSSRRGAAALVTLRKALKAKKDVYITPDGPRGPRYQLQMGALKLAQVSGAPIVVKLAKPREYWQLKTWDKLKVPKPSTDIKICYEEPIYVSKDLTDEELEELRCSIEERMNRFN